MEKRYCEEVKVWIKENALEWEIRGCDKGKSGMFVVVYY